MIQSGLICVKKMKNEGRESFQAVKSICCFGKQIG